MANKSAILSVKIVTDASKGQKGLKKYQTNLQKFEKGAKRAAKPAAAVFAAGALMAKGLVSAGEAAGTSNARIENSVQGLGKFGSKHEKVANRIVDNAEKMARNTGIDQNVIKQSQDTLLKFDSVADSAGEMGGQFDKATAAAADLSASGLGSMERISLTLGRSLEQPAKGLSRLSRLGITFTQQEEDKIKALDKSGDKLGAQAIIMGKVEAAAGGTAEATANASDKMKVGFSQAAEAIGTTLMPAFEKLVEVALTASQWAQENTGLIITIGAVLIGVATAILLVNGALMAMRAAIAVATAVQWLFNAAMAANPIALVVLAIAALVAGLVWFFTQTEIGRAAWAAFTSFMQTATAAVVAFVTGAWQWITEAFQNTVTFITEAWANTIAALQTAASAVGDFIAAVWATIVAVFQLQVAIIVAAWNATIAALQTAASAVGDFIAGVWDTITGAWDTAVGTIKSVWDAGMGFLSSTAESVIGGIRGFIDGIVDSVKSAIDWVKQLFNFEPPAWLNKAASAVGLMGEAYMRPAFDIPDNGAPFFATAAEPMPLFAGRAAAPAAAGTGRAPVKVEINFTGLVTDRVGVAREIRKVLRDADALVGA